LDRLGFVNERSPGALGYQFQASGVDNWFAEEPFNVSLLPTIGDVVTFDTLSIPYAFALTAAYDTGKTVAALIDCFDRLQVDAIQPKSIFTSVELTVRPM